MADLDKRFGWLQALRGIAALSVAAGHCLINLPRDSAHTAIEVLYRLGAGVDLFFVISGFIMVHTTWNDSGGWRSAGCFALKRLRRIWPAYFALTLVLGFATLGWSLFGDPDTRLRFVKSLLFVPASYDSLYANQIIGPGWTLGFEACFYAVFALSLLFARWRWVFLAAWCGIVLVLAPLLCGASLIDVFRAYATEYPLDYLKLASNPFMWEFAMGGAAAALYHSRLRIRSERICVVAASGAVGFAAWNTFSLVVPGSLGVAAVFAMMIATIAIAGKTIAIAAPKPLCALGDISYTLYLQHLAVIQLLQRIYPALGLQDALASLWNIPGTLAVCVLVALLTSRLLEQDLLRWARSALGTGRRTFIGQAGPATTTSEAPSAAATDGARA